MTDASQTTYSPNDPSKWTTGPSEVDAALDELGDRAPSAITAWTDNAILRGDGTTAIQGSSATINDGGVLTADHITCAGVLNTSQLGLVDAKGDLIVGTTADGITRLAVGSDGQVPVAYSAATTGIAWTTIRPALNFPIGFQQGNITDVTAFATRQTHFVYLGPVFAAYTTAILYAKVTTAYVSGGTTFAEVAIFSGTYGGVSGSTVTRRGYTDVAASYNSTGVKATSITLTGVTPGMELWAVWGCRSTGTIFQLRAFLADEILVGTGMLQSLSQPSTIADSTAVAADATVKPVCAVQFS